MKKYLLLFLFTFKMVAQDMPISESNYFTYDKYTYGVNLNNVSYFQQLQNGEVIVSEYSGTYYKINNLSLQTAIPELKEKASLIDAYFMLPNKIEYYCTNQEIFIVKNNKIIETVILNSQNDFSVSFQKLNDVVYFTTVYKNKKTTLRSFDGKKTKNLINLKHDEDRYMHQLFATDKIYVIDYQNSNINFFEYKNNALEFIKSDTLKTKNLFYINKFKDLNNYSGFTKFTVFDCKEGKIKIYPENTEFSIPFYRSNFYDYKNSNNHKIYGLGTDSLDFLFNTTFNSKTILPFYNSFTNSYYTATGTDFLRFFPHLRKYLRLFNNSNTNEVFSLTQDNLGNIWAGSYQGNLSMISNSKIIESTNKSIMFMNGGLAYKDRMLLFGESLNGALLFSNPNEYKKLTTDVTFFYGAISKKNKLYLGSSGQGLWFTDVSNLDKNKPINWKKITEKEGLKLYNILTICEDKFGNIWMGRTGQGIAVYNPKTNKANTWLKENKEIDFGSMCSVLDSKNKLWFGKNDGGLCFYDGKNESDFDVKNFKSIDHPLLKTDKEITFIKQWNDYLILGAKDKVLLFDLKKWYYNKTVSVRYLNPMETSFTNVTEQNTCLVDKRDESVWFATSDMVYQWDIKKWLSLPTFKVTPTILIKKDSLETEYSTTKNIEFKPTENSFDIQLKYQTKDNMPRYINMVLAKKDEKPIFDKPNLETKYHFSNLSSGRYILYIRVCQQDGSFDVFEYPIIIDSFLWQKWWFWLVLSLIPIVFIFYYFQKRNEIEKQKKKLSQLNLSSLSNQFRPHFMLNALNSIGSQLEDKPHAEKVISRLGESINILYGFTQKNEFTHIFQNEWKLVKNIIEIQRLLFIPDLDVTITGKDLMELNYKIPVGLIQIPIENALLHGLRNKETKPYNLEIAFSEYHDNYLITIIDNGVGREKAIQMNNFKKNGNGLKTVYEMIKIINHHHANAIKFTITDLENNSGTVVIIELKKEIDYDKIKL